MRSIKNKPNELTKLRSANAYWGDDVKIIKDVMSGAKGNGEKGMVDLESLTNYEMQVLVKELDRRFIQLWDKVSYERKLSENKERFLKYHLYK